MADIQRFVQKKIKWYKRIYQKNISYKFIKSILTDFANNHGLEQLEEFKQFEHLSNFLTISKHYPEAFDSAVVFENVDMDADSNFDKDRGALLINGNLVINASDIELFGQNSECSCSYPFQCIGYIIQWSFPVFTE